MWRHGKFAAGKGKYTSLFLKKLKLLPDARREIHFIVSIFLLDKNVTVIIH